jgi:hypothetical protein
MFRSRCVRAGFLVALACAASIPILGDGAGAQEWNGLSVSEGPAGTSVTISGNLIGCYASGPGLESATWGLPDRVALYFDNEVRDAEQTEAFLADLVADPNEVLRLEEVASHEFGEAGWELTFTVPDVRPGPHLVILSFQPVCNYRSVEAPNGFTHMPANVPLSFCITDDGTCPSATSLPTSGDDLGGGVRGMRTGTGSVDILGEQIRTNVLVGGTALVLIAIVAAAAAAAAAASAASTAALPAAAAVPALPAAAAAAAPALVAESTAIGATGYTIAELLSVRNVGALSHQLWSIRRAIYALRAGTANPAQLDLLRSFGLLL